jgi:hypothetical protein
VANADAGHPDDFAFVVLLDPRHDVQQRRFSDPFSPRTPIFAPGKKFSEMFLMIVRWGGTVLLTLRIV